jgi:hypothetical protein
MGAYEYIKELKCTNCLHVDVCASNLGGADLSIVSEDCHNFKPDMKAVDCCPCCGSAERVGLVVDSWNAKLKVEPWYLSPAYLLPHICLNCGTIYVDRDTINVTKVQLEEYQKHAQKQS